MTYYYSLHNCLTWIFPRPFFYVTSDSGRVWNFVWLNSLLCANATNQQGALFATYFGAFGLIPFPLRLDYIIVDRSCLTSGHALMEAADLISTENLNSTDVKS